MMMGRRFRAPSDNGGVLAEPPIAGCEALALANRARLDTWSHDFQGRAASVLRRQARADLIRASEAHLDSFGLASAGQADSADVPLILSGHQPELFHPGVWVKNFVGAGIAARLGGVSAHIVVDNDLPKSASIRVPSQRDGELHTHRVEFDSTSPEVPFECWRATDPGTFDSFPERVAQVLGPLVGDPLLERFWPVARRHVEAGRSIGAGFAAARRTIEQEWGIRNADLALSQVCETDSFLWFFCHLIAHLDRFRSIHNAALETYRHVNRIRSRNHPVPPLRADGDWLQAPFWVWRKGSPRRRSLMVAARGREIALRISGEEDAFLLLPLGPEREACCAVERLRELPSMGIRLRTRALTTTLYSRLIASDLFIHGIGGAKYDELGDTILSQFFGIEPPGFLTLSLTLWLDLPRPSATVQERQALHHEIRDLEFNAQRHLSPAMLQENRPLVERKQAAIALGQATRMERIHRYREIRAVNAELSNLVAGPLRALRSELAEHDLKLAQSRWARYREYASVLFSAAKLRDALVPFAAAEA